MSFDLVGLNPKSKEGVHEIFSVWTWIPIWTWVTDFCPDLLTKESQDGFSNDGYIVQERAALRIGLRICEAYKNKEIETYRFDETKVPEGVRKFYQDLLKKVEQMESDKTLTQMSAAINLMEVDGCQGVIFHTLEEGSPPTEVDMRYRVETTAFAAAARFMCLSGGFQIN